MAAAAAVVSGPVGLTPEAMDVVLGRIETDFKQLKVSRGSLARSLKERELVYQFGLARQLMMSVLSCDSGDRRLLNAIFGGDCTRVSRVRAVLESVVLVQADERLHSCMNACISIEKVLCDLGFSRALREAQTAQRKALVSGRGRATAPQVVPSRGRKLQAPTAAEAAENFVSVKSGSLARESSGGEETPRVEEKPVMLNDSQSKLIDARTMAVEEPLPSIAETDMVGEEGQQAAATMTPMQGEEYVTLEDTAEKATDEVVDVITSEIGTVVEKVTIYKAEANDDAVVQEGEEASEEADPMPDDDVFAPVLSEPLLPGRVLADPNEVVLREINPVVSSMRSSSSPACASKPWKAKRTMEKSTMPSPEKIEPAVATEASQVGATQTDAARHSVRSFMLLSHEYQQLIRQFYAHYVGPGGMSSGAGLSLSKFRRFLRQCRLLTDICTNGTGSASLTPGANNRMLHRSAPAWDVPTRLGGTDSSQLTQTEADLILVRVAGEGGPAGAGQRLYTADAFGHALEHVAAHYRPACKPLEALELLCSQVLVPLGEQVLKIGDAPVRAAVSALAVPEVAALMKRNLKALDRIFCCYATGVGAPEPYRRGQWTAQTTSRFASEAGIAGDISHERLQHLFCSCAAYESACGRGEKGRISFAGFQLALVVLAQNIHTSKTQPLDRLSFLFFRLGSQLRVNMNLHNGRGIDRSAAPKGLR